MNLSSITLKRSIVAYTLIIITLCVSKEVEVPYYAHLLYTRKSLEIQNFIIFCYNYDTAKWNWWRKNGKFIYKWWLITHHVLLQSCGKNIL